MLLDSQMRDVFPVLFGSGSYLLDSQMRDVFPVLFGSGSYLLDSQMRDVFPVLFSSGSYLLDNQMRDVFPVLFGSGSYGWYVLDVLFWFWSALWNLVTVKEWKSTLFGLLGETQWKSLYSFWLALWDWVKEFVLPLANSVKLSERVYSIHTVDCV